MFFYLRAALIFVWICIASAVGCLMAIFRWGDLDLDRDIARLIGRFGLKLAGVKLEVENAAGLEAHHPCVFVANHQSSMDVLVFGAAYPSRTIVIGKRELLYIPFFGLAFVAAGNIMINRKNRAHSIAGLNRAVAKVRDRGASVYIFPEGTRNRTDQPMLPFKKGAFHMAVAAQIPVVPVVCQPLGATVGGWKERRLAGGTVRVRVLAPVSSAGLTQDQAQELSVKVRERMLEAFRGLSADSSVKPS
jgi:1-acyl-sn-glycerol-3-phosphate acyltransferase